jgi:transcriptional regulator with XRE-family HTH domain
MTMPGDPATRSGVPAARARARYAPGSAANDPASGQALGALLRQLRTERGMGTPRLAERAGVARSTIQRLERGQIRPRPSTLAWIAGALDPDRRDEIRGRLADAAGDGIAADADGWLRYRAGRVSKRHQAGLVPLPAGWERRIRLFAASEAMWQASMALAGRLVAVMGKPSASTADLDLMLLSMALLDESRLLARDAGGIVRGTPARRRRGGPADVSPYPPEAGDLRATWRWLWQWQCREGRLRPRSARERAIAETGARERRHVAENPAPPAVTADDVAIRKA